jgi:hypothetical protein
VALEELSLREKIGNCDGQDCLAARTTDRFSAREQNATKSRARSRESRVELDLALACCALGVELQIAIEGAPSDAPFVEVRVFWIRGERQILLIERMNSPEC